MRYESWAERWLHPKSQSVLERNPAIRVSTGQSGFIYPCLRLHLSKGTCNLPTNVFNISTYLFIQFTFLSCLLKDHKLLKDTQSGWIWCFRRNAAGVHVVNIVGPKWKCNMSTSTGSIVRKCGTHIHGGRSLHVVMIVWLFLRQNCLIGSFTFSEMFEQLMDVLPWNVIVVHCTLRMILDCYFDPLLFPFSATRI